MSDGGEPPFETIEPQCKPERTINEGDALRQAIRALLDSDEHQHLEFLVGRHRGCLEANAVSAAIKAEREACAKIADECARVVQAEPDDIMRTSPLYLAVADAARNIAAMIRGRC